jgi:hypothetical protein
MTAPPSAQVTNSATPAPAPTNPTTILVVTNANASLVVAIAGTNFLLNGQVVGEIGPDGRVRQLTGQPFTDDDGDQLMVVTNQGAPTLVAVDQNGNVKPQSCLLCILILLLGAFFVYLVWRCAKSLNNTNPPPQTNSQANACIEGLQSSSADLLSSPPPGSTNWSVEVITNLNGIAGPPATNQISNVMSDWLGNPVAYALVVTNVIFTSTNLATWTPESACTLGFVGRSNSIDTTLMAVTCDTYDSSPFMTNWYSITGTKGQRILHLLGGTGGIPPQRSGVPVLFYSTTPWP